MTRQNYVFFKNHIFSCSIEDKTDTQIIMKLRMSDRDCDAAIPHFMPSRQDLRADLCSRHSLMLLVTG